MSGFVRQTFIWVLLTTAGPWSVADAAHAERAEFDLAYRQQLESLAAKCDELGLGESAKRTREWFIPRDPNRYYLFLPPESDSLQPTENDSPLIHKWHDKLTEFRRQQAQRLFALATESSRTGRDDVAYRLLHEVLHEDPNHAQRARCWAIAWLTASGAVRIAVRGLAQVARRIPRLAGRGAGIGGWTASIFG